MAVTGLLALLDDISMFLDDVAILTKIATKKTAGVLGDDLALNAQQVTGVRAERELPVVWAVTKGSLINKCILVPVALVLSFIAPWLINYLLMVGGAFLCFEGFEKLAHKFIHKQTAGQHKERLMQVTEDATIDLVEFERDKIKGAIRTDFILSAEVVVIALGTMQDAGLLLRVVGLTTIAFAITIGVYGLVAAIVKLDDLGLHLLNRSSDKISHKVARKFGNAILAFCPWLMKTLSVVGTAAMFLVGGGILLHGLPWLHELVHFLEGYVQFIPHWVQEILWSALCGISFGAILVFIVEGSAKVFRKSQLG